MGELVRSERRSICDLFLEVGPDAPTLCGEWRTADLAAHLHVRESKPLAGIGIVVPALADKPEKAMRKALDEHGYEGVVEKVRNGPPFGPFRWFEDQANLNEYVVHHEDVRRGDGTGEPRPEPEVADLEDAVWPRARRGGKLMTRSIKGTGLRLVWPDHDDRTLRTGDHTATLTGRPIELALYLNGRKPVARVEVSGDEQAVERVKTADFGF